MNKEFPEPEATLACVLKQEEALKFESFTAEDGWELGLTARRLALMKPGANLAIDVTVGGVQVFRATVGTATPNNARWIGRKINVVMETWKSSLRTKLEMMLNNRTVEEFGWSQAEHALAGGCVPIWVQGLGVVGTITVSGLPQKEDHQLAVDALAAYLGVSAPSVLS